MYSKIIKKLRDLENGKNPFLDIDKILKEKEDK